jgi:hypothetical protein
MPSNLFPFSANPAIDSVSRCAHAFLTQSLVRPSTTAVRSPCLSDGKPPADLLPISLLGRNTETCSILNIAGGRFAYHWSITALYRHLSVTERVLCSRLGIGSASHA